MNLRTIACHWRLGAPVDLVQVAVDALMEGIDSPSLRLLAGERSGAPYLGPVFEKAPDELGIEPMDAESACFVLAREIARQIVAGEVTEVEGARRIYEEVYRRRPFDRTPNYVWEFVSVYSSIEDTNWYASETGRPVEAPPESEKQRIRSAAETLAGASAPPKRAGGGRVD